MMENIVAIIGRPNVGKSTIFNRIMGKRIAIVHPQSGVTRDRNYGEAEWTGKRFFIIDTGGFVPDSEEEFNKQIRNQVRIALQEANKILFVTDGEAGVHPVDEEIATIIRKYHGKKEVLLAVNKVDNERRENNINEFYKLGLGTPFGISGLSGRNVADMLDILTKDIQQSDEKVDERIKFAIIGKPNAGKSSIINAILKEERNIVTDIPGTTRDSIDSEIKYHGESIVLIDTAGLRKKSKVSGESLDFFSAIRTYKSIQRCDVAILVIDASELMEGLSHSSDIRSAVFKLDKQDVRIIEEVVKFKKGILLVINKWDLVEKDSNTSVLIEKKINEHLKSYNYLKYIFISALTKQRIHKVIEEAKNIFDERKKTVKTSELNEKILNEIKKNPPASTRGKEIKINYVTQVKNAPPVFTFFSNEPAMIATNYRKFLEKRIRDNFGFQGVPIIMNFKKKN